MTIKETNDLINMYHRCGIDKTYIPTTPEECRAYAQGYMHCGDIVVDILKQVEGELEE